MSIAEKLGIPEKDYELKIGRSFERNPPTAFHSLRYDFKPASVDVSQEATVSVGEGNQITVVLPHIQGCGTALTMYKGNKRPLQKECVLMINPDTGEMTLEKLSFSIQVKKIRIEGSSKITAPSQRPVTPLEKRKGSPPFKKDSASKNPVASMTAVTSAATLRTPATTSSMVHAKKSVFKSFEEAATSNPISGANVDIMSSNSSDDDSDDENSNASMGPTSVSMNMANAAVNPTVFMNTLSQDLCLSESGSDSDSDDDSDSDSD